MDTNNIDATGADILNIITRSGKTLKFDVDLVDTDTEEPIDISGDSLILRVADLQNSELFEHEFVVDDEANIAHFKHVITYVPGNYKHHIDWIQGEDVYTVLEGDFTIK